MQMPPEGAPELSNSARYRPFVRSCHIRYGSNPCSASSVAPPCKPVVIVRFYSVPPSYALKGLQSREARSMPVHDFKK
jgi:hypothetical protein